METLLTYSLGNGVKAFSAGKDCPLPYQVVTGHQIHGCKVAVVERSDTTREELEGIDALITAVPGIAVGVRTADCIPVLLYDPEKQAVAAIHAGWKGTMNRIVQKTLYEMKSCFGTEPSQIRA